MSCEKTERKYLADSQTRMLIEVWQEHALDLRMQKRNLHIIAQMKEKLERRFKLKLSIIEIKNRIKNLTQKYR